MNSYARRQSTLWKAGLAGALLVVASITVAPVAGASGTTTTTTSPSGTTTTTTFLAATGDAAAIAYYTLATNKCNAQPAITTVFHHIYWFGYSSPGQWRLAGEVAKRPAPYMRAVNDTQTQRLVNGKVSWEKDVFALPCAVGKVCSSSLVPLAVFQNAKHVYWTELNGPKTTPRCWYVASKAAGTGWMVQDFINVGYPAWYVGNSPFTTNSVFDPMTTSGDTVSIKNTYVYTNGHRATTELDVINSSTQLFTKSTVRVAKGSAPNEPAYSYYTTITKPAYTPRAPAINVCK